MTQMPGSLISGVIPGGGSLGTKLVHSSMSDCVRMGMGLHIHVVPGRGIRLC